MTYVEKLRLDNRVAVVTGGGQGIGACCAQALAEFGAQVIIVDKNQQSLDKQIEIFNKQGITVTGEVLDVTDSSQVDSVFTNIKNSFGKIDILVNNAGVAISDVPAVETSDEHWRLHMDVNLDGLFWCCRKVGQIMLEQGSGSIINIGSMSGIIVNKPQPQSFYNASKAAVHQLTKSLAAEWGARGVRVNAVAPTYIETPLTQFGMNECPDMYAKWLDMTPMARVGQPEEVASIVQFLASDASSIMTGAIVNADAGYTCW